MFLRFAVLVSLEFTAHPVYNYDRCKRHSIGLTAEGETCTTDHQPFGTPDFTLPGDVKAIEASAFEGTDASVVYIPDGCETIGACGACTPFMYF